MPSKRPAKRAAKAAHPTAPGAAAGPAPKRRVVVTTVRIYEDQWSRLQEMGFRRKMEAGGRYDASGVLREVLDKPDVLPELEKKP